MWNGTAAAGGTQYNLKGNLTDARRFQNNTSTSLIAPAVQTYFPCYQPFVTDAVLAPSATGTGVGIQGDSGGPWFTGGAAGAVTVTPKNPNDYNGANPPVIEPAGTAVGANTVIPVNYSNAESAEFVATAGFTTNSPQFAVPLLTFPQTLTLLGDPQNTYGNTQGSYEFVSSYAGINPKVAVPEPGIVSLAAAGSLALLRRRGRSVLGR